MLLVDRCWLLLSLLFGVGSSFAWLIVVGCCCWVLAVLWLHIGLVDFWWLFVVVVVAVAVMFVISY